MKAALWLLALAVLQSAPLLAQTASPSPRQNAGRALSLDALFQLLDKDGDGKISQTEATGGYAARFSLWDTNGDGFATREEIHNYRLTRRHR